MRFRSFGRQIFSMYEKYPMTLNSIIGGMVYMAGEVTIQINHQNNNNNEQLSHKDEKTTSDVINSSYQQQCIEHYQKIDGKRTIKIGLLGSIENGVFMLTWYRFLNHAIGTGVSTKIVVIKCLCDQLFFATQQDFLFLALCAYQDSAKLPAAIAEVKLAFLRTWLMDCSLWPMVNFVGFAWVPYRLQPTYMAIVQFFWQVYVSSIAATGAGASTAIATSISTPMTLQSSATSDVSTSTSSNPPIVNNSNCFNADNNSTTTDKDITTSPTNSFHNIVEQEIRRNAKEESATATSAAADSANVNVLNTKTIVDKSVANATRGVPTSGNDSSTSTTAPPSSTVTTTTVASASDAVLYQVFQRIDSDSSGYIDGTELTTELSRRYRRRISRIELEKIVKEMDVNSDGKISFEEFKRAIQSGTAKETGLWCALREDVTLLRGAQAIIKRKQILDSKHTANNSNNNSNNNNKNNDSSSSTTSSPTYDSNCTAEQDDDLSDAVVSASVGFGLLALASLIRRVIFKI